MAHYSQVSTVSVTDFKAKCPGFFEQVKNRGMEFIVTKQGEPVAKVVPIVKKFKSLRNSLKGIAKIKGDIINFDTSDDWEVLKDG